MKPTSPCLHIITSKALNGLNLIQSNFPDHNLPQYQQRPDTQIRQSSFAPNTGCDSIYLSSSSNIPASDTPAPKRTQIVIFSVKDLYHDSYIDESSCVLRSPSQPNNFHQAVQENSPAKVHYPRHFREG